MTLFLLFFSWSISERFSYSVDRFFHQNPGWWPFFVFGLRLLQKCLVSLRSGTELFADRYRRAARCLPTTALWYLQLPVLYITNKIQTEIETNGISICFVIGLFDKTILLYEKSLELNRACPGLMKLYFVDPIQDIS